MYSEAKKLHIIEEVLKVNNDAILIELENILSRSAALKPKKLFANFLGKLSSKEIGELESNIENGCEQINEDDWK